MNRTARCFTPSLPLCFRPRMCLAVLTILSIAAVAWAADPDWDTLPFTPIHEMQGVDANGNPTWSVPTPPPDYDQAYKLRGVVLNNPGEMLDGTPNYREQEEEEREEFGWYLGGQWQVYIQAVAPDDFGGAALWMGQNYGNHGWHYPDHSYSYTDFPWTAELYRLNCPEDRNTGLLVDEPLRAGDLIEVHARAGLHYKGKFNCNEQHDNVVAYNFDIFVLQRDVPLTPTAITLDDVMDGDGNFLFDQSRATGAEFYQGQYVTLQNVTIVDADDWEKYGDLKVTDGTREFDVRLGDHEAFDSAALPVGELDITGIFDQESWNLKGGYRMWATTPRAFSPVDEPLPGDANCDDIVDDEDASALAAHWQTASGASWFDGDFNDDGAVDDQDASILAAHWQEQEQNAPVPEPAAVVLLAAIGFALILRTCFEKGATGCLSASAALKCPKNTG